MKVLVACEFSGIVREAFRKHGHDAWSCDLLPAEDGSPFHLRGNVVFALDARQAHYYFEAVQPGVLLPWDMLIGFPPCTDLCVSGARWFKEKKRNGSQDAAIDFFLCLVKSGVPKAAVENPIGIMSTHFRKPDQIIQPWQFGHGETKATCLWLKNLPKLKATNIVEGRVGRVHHESPGPNRWKERSRTYQGIADAMAEQWGSL